MKSKIKSLMIIYGAMAMMGDLGYHDDSEYELLTEDEKSELKTIAKKNKIERLKKQGVREYFYGENIIYARNKKNADRKARNKGYKFTH